MNMDYKVEIVNTDKIKPNPNNTRQHTDRDIQAIIQSIHKFGFRNPIICNKEGIILCGNGRYEAIKKMGITEVPVHYADLTEEEAKAFAIMDNRSAELSTWNLEYLLPQLESLKLDGLLEFTGFNEFDMKDLNKELESLKPELEAQEDDFNSEDIKENIHKVERGDIYLLGKHRLLCGDSTIKEDVDLLIEEKKVDVVLSDPPYNVDYSEKNTFLNAISRGNRIQKPIENDKIDDFKEFIINYLKIIPYNEYNIIYLFTSGKEISNVILAIKEIGYYSQDLKWVKNNHILGRLDYNPKSENIIYGWKGKHKFYGGFQTDVIECDKPVKSDLHPTMKPIELLSKLINHSSDEGFIIYDGFLGSGSTLMACEQLNRICYGMEIDPHYCSVIIERFHKLRPETEIYRIRAGNKEVLKL